MRLPVWLGVVLVFLAVGTPIGWAYWARASAEHFAELDARNDSIRAANDSLEARHIKRDSARAELEGRVAADSLVIDSLQKVAQGIDRKAASAREDRKAAAGDLAEYFADDTTGTRLLAELEQAMEVEVDAERRRAEVGELENAALRRSLIFKNRIIAQSDTTVAEFRAQNARLMTQNAALIAEAERWYRKANPPWTIRLLKTGVECGAAGLAGWAASGEAGVGVAAGGGCALVKVVMR